MDQSHIKTVYPDADKDESFEDSKFDPLKSIGEFSLAYGRSADDDEYVSRIKDANAILLGWDLPASVMAQALNLEVVSFTGIGAGKFVDINLAREKNITVCNCPGYSDNTVAEHALALLLACARHVPRLDKQLRGGEWDQSLSGMELRGKRLGVIGFGGIGVRFAEIAKALGMVVSVWTRNPSPERAARHGVEFGDLDEVVSSSDVISLHLTSSPETEGFIDAEVIGKMRPGVVFINTARAEIVDELALVDALSRGHVLSAGVDVFMDEPLPAGHPYSELDNVVITPHIGYRTPDATTTLYQIGIENIVSFYRGEPINVVS